MLTFPVEVWAALKGNQSGRTKAIVSHRGLQVELWASAGSVSVNGDQSVQSSGSVVLAGAGPESLVPRDETDMLAPFGQELALFRVVRVGSREWTIPLGTFLLTRASKGREWSRDGRVLSWEVEVSFSDRLLQIERDDFLSVDGPQPGATVWGEVRRLSPIPIQTTLANADVSPATVYDSRIGGIETLLGLLDSDPHLTRSGVLTSRRRDRWLTDTAADFEVDAVIEWSEELSGDFYNQVSVSSSTDPAVTATAVIDDPSDPMSRGRAGGRTYKHSAPIYETVSQAQAGAETTLRRLRSRRSKLVTVTGTPELLLLEPGDFGRFTDPVEGRSILGEVRTIDMPVDPTAAVRVGVMTRDV